MVGAGTSHLASATGRRWPPADRHPSGTPRGAGRPRRPGREPRVVRDLLVGPRRPQAVLQGQRHGAEAREDVGRRRGRGERVGPGQDPGPHGGRAPRRDVVAAAAARPRRRRGRGPRRRRPARPPAPCPSRRRGRRPGRPAPAGGRATRRGPARPAPGRSTNSSGTGRGGRPRRGRPTPGSSARRRPAGRARRPPRRCRGTGRRGRTPATARPRGRRRGRRPRARARRRRGRRARGGRARRGTAPVRPGRRRPTTTGPARRRRGRPGPGPARPPARRSTRGRTRARPRPTTSARAWSASAPSNESASVRSTARSSSTITWRSRSPPSSAGTAGSGIAARCASPAHSMSNPWEAAPQRPPGSWRGRLTTADRPAPVVTRTTWARAARISAPTTHRRAPGVGEQALDRPPDVGAEQPGGRVDRRLGGHRARNRSSWRRSRLVGRPVPRSRTNTSGACSRGGGGRAVVDHALGRQRRTHPLVDHPRHLEHAEVAVGPGLDPVADPHGGRRLGRHAVDPHVAALAGRRGQRPRLEDPHGPQPLVDPGLVHGAMVAEPRANRRLRAVSPAPGEARAVGSCANDRTRSPRGGRRDRLRRRVRLLSRPHPTAATSHRVRRRRRQRLVAVGHRRHRPGRRSASGCSPTCSSRSPCWPG